MYDSHRKELPEIAGIDARSNWKSKRAGVTGAAGFIGSHLCEELVRSGASVRALVHYNATDNRGNLRHLPDEITSEIEVVRGDLANPEGMEAFSSGLDVVFHLAALIAIPYSYLNPREFFETNVIGTYNAARGAARSEVARFVHTSTSEVYGTARFAPITEDHPLTGQSPYSASKIGADKVVESLHLSFDFPAVTVRPFNTYGPRQSPRAVIPAIVSQLLIGDVVELGSLDPERDFTFVSDTVRGFMAAGSADGVEGQTVNLGSGKAISVGSLAEKLVAKVNPKARIETDESRIRPDKSEVGLLLASNAKAAELLGWKPEVSLDQGLDAVVDFMRAHPVGDGGYAV